MKTTSKIILIVSGLPLVIYPLLFFVCIQILTGPRSGREGFTLIMAASACAISVLSYPISYILGWIKAKESSKTNLLNETKMALIPVMHLGIIFILTVLWAVTEN